MLHPDYQYSPRLVTAMASMIVSGHYDVVLGSRILGRGALKGGMPLYKYIANRALTFGENMLLGQKLSEYHTGYRAWSRHVLQTLRLEKCSDDFVFDNQMLAQAVFAKFTIGEISCPTRYFDEASSINFPRSVSYGIGVLQTALSFRLAKWNIQNSPLFESKNRKPASSSFLKKRLGRPRTKKLFLTGTWARLNQRPFSSFGACYDRYLVE